MSRAALYVPAMAAYSVFALLLGTDIPVVAQRCVLLTFACSPKSVNATILRVLVVVPVLLVTQISTRPMLIPVFKLGKARMPSA